MNTAKALRVDSAPSAGAVQRASVELESTDCLLCGGDDFETVIVAGDELTRIGGHFRVVRCLRCRLSYTNPRPTLQSLGLFYPETYDPYAGHERDRTRSWHHQLERAVLRTYHGYPPQPATAAVALLGVVGKALIRTKRRRESWVPFRSPGRMLDFGCGAGDYLKRMRQLGWQVEGIDVSAEMAQRLRKSAGLRVHVGSLPHRDIGPESYDAVTMWHSLEHVFSPPRVLRGARDVLRPGGLLVVGVPNFGSWSFRKFQHNWNGLELPRHLTHFTAETLAAMAEAEQFRVLSVAHVGRASSIRKSASRAAQSLSAPWWQRSLWRSIPSRAAARWSEQTGQADLLRLIAEKV